jgi:oxidase EvaA
VTHWTQPLVSPRQEGIVAFVVKKINGILHFLMQAKVEAGNFDVIEMAPTVQCLTGSYKDVAPEDRPPFLDYVIQAGAEKVRLSTLQSEEGGRFFREANRNLLIEGEHDFPTEVPDRYIWMTLNQIKGFIKYNNFLNVQCRSLTSSLGFL